MNREPKVITVDYNAVPKRWWELPYSVIYSMADAYRYVICTRCGKAVAVHTWFVINTETNYVYDCSEMPL